MASTLQDFSRDSAGFMLPCPVYSVSLVSIFNNYCSYNVKQVTITFAAMWTVAKITCQYQHFHPLKLRFLCADLYPIICAQTLLLFTCHVPALQASSTATLPSSAAFSCHLTACSNYLWRLMLHENTKAFLLLSFTADFGKRWSFRGFFGSSCLLWF